MNLLKLITPTNIQAEKEKFFSSNSYNPIFTYEWEKHRTNVPSSYDKRTILTQAVMNQDIGNISKLAADYFQVSLDDQLLMIARSKLVPSETKLPQPSIRLVQEAFEAAFDFFGLDYKAVVTDQPGFNFRPMNTREEVLISKYANFENLSLQGEVLHEMTHIVRYENGKFNGIKAADNYLPCDEGLACFLQDYKSESGRLSMYQHAAEYAVTEVCLNGSLRDGVAFLCSIGFSKELAWQRAIRHKFGFKDTSLSGDIWKPAMYFYYEQKIAALGNDRILGLLSGKVSLDYKMPYAGRFTREQVTAFFRIGT